MRLDWSENVMDPDARLIHAVRTASQKLTGTGDFGELLREVLALCVEAVDAGGGTIYLHDPAARRLRFQYVLPPEVEPLLPSRDIPEDFGAAGAAFGSASTIRREFPPKVSDAERNEFERATGTDVATMLVAALTTGEETPIGVVQLLNKKAGPFTPQDAATIETIASVATMAYVNRRLTLDSARASALLGMGKVSHDIGNLAASLHASIAFSEMALDGLQLHLEEGEIDPKTENFLLVQHGIFGDLKQSVERIVGYSRLISDMSAGRGLRPTRRPGALAPVIARSAAFLESDARSKGIAIRYELDDGAPDFDHDDLYIFRIVQNLVGNAIKAVAETIDDETLAQSEEDEIHGAVTVRYRYLPKDHLLEVGDTGPGMNAETIARVLSGDAGSQWSRSSGSGWGLRIVSELASSHEGRLEIESELGKGTVFRVRLCEEAVASA